MKSLISTEMKTAAAHAQWGKTFYEEAHLFINKQPAFLQLALRVSVSEIIYALIEYLTSAGFFTSSVVNGCENMKF